MKRTLLSLVLGTTGLFTSVAIAQDNSGNPTLPPTAASPLPPSKVGPATPKPDVAPPGTPSLPVTPATKLPPSRVAPATTGGPNGEQPSSSDTEPTTEPEFLAALEKTNREQLQLARLATLKASDSRVKDLAKTLTDDLTTSTTAVTRISKETNVPPPIATNIPNPFYKRLSVMEGPAFDAAWLQEARRVHTATLARYKAASDYATTESVKSYVTTTLPTLQASGKRLEQLTEANGGSTPPADTTTTTPAQPATGEPATPRPVGPTPSGVLPGPARIER